MGTIFKSKPNASPCATEAPIRIPINEPGPFPKTRTSRSDRVTPAFWIILLIIGIRICVCAFGSTMCDSKVLPFISNATEQASEDVSRDSILISDCFI